jgi:Zn-dependent protease with chaperone function
MTTIGGAYYDGKTSRRAEVRITLDRAGVLHISGSNGELNYPLSQLRVMPRVGNTPRSIYLPDGAKCETPDNDAIDAFLRQRGTGRWQAFVHALESRLLYVLPTVALTVLVLWALVQYGVPALAKHLAFALPESVDAQLGAGGLAALDRSFFSPSALDPSRQRQLRALFARMTQGLDDRHRYRLEFRRGKTVGANAFALPSGIIVVTDELVALAHNDNEIAAVLAHEIGHVVHRHALRRMLQDSAVVLVIASVTGDVSSVSSLAATVPTLLVEAKYSRAFEREADGFALDYLRAHDIPPRYFADILRRLERQRRGGGVHDFLATHPTTEERVQLFEQSPRK